MYYKKFLYNGAKNRAAIKPAVACLNGKRGKTATSFLLVVKLKS